MYKIVQCFHKDACLCHLNQNQPIKPECYYTHTALIISLRNQIISTKALI
jgi:hypothetical protein